MYNFEEQLKGTSENKVFVNKYVSYLIKISLLKSILNRSSLRWYLISSSNLYFEIIP